MRVAEVSAPDPGERIARLEVEVQHLRSTIDRMDTKVTELHTLLQQARGARWAFIVIWIGVGALVSKVASFLPFVPR